jgi:hypothetical protein
VPRKRQCFGRFHLGYDLVGMRILRIIGSRNKAGEGERRLRGVHRPPGP